MHAEILVIGAGTAGLRTAMTAASNGAKTILVGDGSIAGTCLNTGCIPTKALLHAADTLRTVRQAGEVGIVADGEPDFKMILQRVRGIVDEGRSHAQSAAEGKEGLTYIEGRASFVAPKAVEVGHTRVTFDKAIIATGTRPSVPPIPGLTEVPYLTNESILDLDAQPKHLIIIGGGYIACEYATFFATIGTRVTILERAPDILTLLDEDIRSTVRASLEAMGVRILTGVTTQQVTHNKTFTCTLSGAKVGRVSGDALLVAAGRIPNTERLGLERAGVERDGRGFIPVDDQLRTNIPSIYAIGDVNGRDLFAHSAKREGWLALEHAVLGKRVNRPDLTPWAVFTHPAVAGFGASEQDLKREKRSFSILEAPFHGCGKARIVRADTGKVKILHDGGCILGAVIVGPDADNLIHELLALERLGDRAIATLQDLVHIHPTLAEVFEGLRERA